ncbi:hypothetical protein PRIC2_002575 [Phytophthora ramorum]
MAHPSHAPALARTSSVARSLTQAAAALRAQEWRGAHSTDTGVYMASRRQALRYTRDWEPHDAQETGREEFYAELRARHRDLTQRQQLAREFYGQQTHYTAQQQTQYREATTGENEMYRTQLRRRHHAPPTADAAAGHFRSSYAPPPQRNFSREDVNRVSMRNERMQAAAVAPVQVSVTQLERIKSPASSAGTPRTGRTTESVATAPSVVEDVDAEPDSEAAVVEDEAGTQKKKKRVRYLRDTDRRNIIKRIENGEKQASLAREFGVTRAAICHIKKNRFEILSRYSMLVQSAQEMDLAENFVGPPGVEMMVHEVRVNSVLLLMTMLRDNRSSGATFRRVAGRLIMILLEEALAILGTASVEVITGTGHLYRGLERRHRFCGVSIGAEGFPFLVLFHQMEPEAPQGSIHMEMETDRRGERAWRLDHMDLPANIIQHKVLLFSATCSTGEAECKAIEALCSVGCDESSISLVMILVASDGIVTVGSRFPQVKIVTGGIDGKVDPQTDSIIPGFGDFVSRYNGS